MRFREPQARPVLVRLAQVLHTFFSLARRLRRAVKGYATVDRFGSRGQDFEFDPDGTYSYASIHVGNHVNLGAGATLLATRAEIRIGNHVMFGPGVTVRGGNHRFDVVGRYIDTIQEVEKRSSDDLGVVIEDDVWVGGNATILHGVRVGRGSVIGASAVVTRSVSPYSIVAGNPARVIGRRFSDEQVLQHEDALGRRRATG